MIFFLTIAFFILGLIIGSFLNVVICRLNTGKTLGGRSMCMSCQNKLHWYDLVPLFSFLALWGRCRTCKTRIAFTYPLVEALTGFVFLVLFLKFMDILFLEPVIFFITYSYYAILFSILIIITVYDLKHKIIPDILSLIFGLLAFVGIFFFSSNNFFVFTPHIPSLLTLFSGVLIALPFLLFFVLSSGAWMGLGDAKLALGLGYLLGLPFGLSALALSFWIGAICGVGLMLFKRGYGMKSEIPFAPYLVIGTFLAFIFELNIFMIGF